MKIYVLFVGIILLNACTTTTSPTKQLTQLSQTTPTPINLQTDYVTAYDNLKTYYQKCVAYEGVYYPNTVYTNGIPVTIPVKTPSRIVDGDIDTQNKQANIRVTMGQYAIQLLQIKPTGTNASLVNFYNSEAKLRSKDFNLKMTDKYANIIKTVGETPTTKCIK